MTGDTVSDPEIGQSTNGKIPVVFKIGMCVCVSLSVLEVQQRKEEVEVLNWFVLFYLGRIVFV